MKDQEVNDKNAQIDALKSKLIELTKELDLTKNERDKYLANLNLDGTASSIPTSKTPINKKR